MATILSSAKHTSFVRAFKDHPASVGETYFEHMRFAGWFAGRLFLAGAAALIHAVIPALFETTAGRHIREIHRRIEHRSDPDQQR